MDAPRPFRFSVTIPPGMPATEVPAFARKAEDLGFDTIAAADHLLDILPPFLALALAGAATSRIRLTTLVLNNGLRHPAMVARESAALQQASGGRFELGIGAGHAAPEHHSIGIPFEAGPARVARLAESVEIIHRLFSGQPATFEGAHYRLHEHTIFPALEEPPPLLIGGNARSLLRLAARTADVVALTGLGRTNPDGLTHDPSGFAAAAVDERVALVRAAAGTRLPAIELNALIQAVLPGEPLVEAARIAERLPGLSAAGVLESPFVLLGSPAQMAEALVARRQRWGISYYSVFAAAMEAIAPVIPLLA